MADSLISGAYTPDSYLANTVLTSSLLNNDNTLEASSFNILLQMVGDVDGEVTANSSPTMINSLGRAIGSMGLLNPIFPMDFASVQTLYDTTSGETHTAPGNKIMLDFVPSAFTSLIINAGPELVASPAPTRAELDGTTYKWYWETGSRYIEFYDSISTSVVVKYTPSASYTNSIYQHQAGFNVMPTLADIANGVSATLNGSDEIIFSSANVTNIIDTTVPNPSLGSKASFVRLTGNIPYSVPRFITDAADQSVGGGFGGVSIPSTAISLFLIDSTTNTVKNKIQASFTFTMAAGVITVLGDAGVLASLRTQPLAVVFSQGESLSQTVAFAKNYVLKHDHGANGGQPISALDLLDMRPGSMGMSDMADAVIPVNITPQYLHRGGFTTTAPSVDGNAFTGDLRLNGGTANTITVTGGSWAAGTATLIIGTHSIPSGTIISVSGVTPTGYNTNYATITSVAATTISYAVTVNPGVWTSGGAVIIYLGLASAIVPSTLTTWASLTAGTKVGRVSILDADGNLKYAQFGNTGDIYQTSNTNIFNGGKINLIGEMNRVRTQAGYSFNMTTAPLIVFENDYNSVNGATLDFDSPSRTPFGFIGRTFDAVWTVTSGNQVVFNTTQANFATDPGNSFNIQGSSTAKYMVPTLTLGGWKTSTIRFSSTGYSNTPTFVFDTTSGSGITNGGSNATVWSHAVNDIVNNTYHVLGTHGIRWDNNSGGDKQLQYMYWSVDANGAWGGNTTDQKTWWNRPNIKLAPDRFTITPKAGYADDTQNYTGWQFGVGTAAADSVPYIRPVTRTTGAEDSGRDFYFDYNRTTGIGVGLDGPDRGSYVFETNVKIATFPGGGGSPTLSHVWHAGRIQYYEEDFSSLNPGFSISFPHGFGRGSYAPLGWYLKDVSSTEFCEINGQFFVNSGTDEVYLKISIPLNGSQSGVSGKVGYYLMTL